MVAPVSSRIFTLERLQKQLSVWRLKADTIVFTNGCFDVLHPGHILYLEEAARLGNRLVVGLNSNASVKRLKGEGRPVNPEADRALMLAALHTVDAVVLFDEDTPADLIKALQPDVLVKGSDYREDEVAGAATVRASGGKVVLVPFVEGYSTTGFLQKIKKM